MITMNTFKIKRTIEKLYKNIFFRKIAKRKKI